jgi:hypothetical protein
MAYNDDIPTLSLDDMQAAITAAVKEAFPSFKTVEFDRDDEDENFPSPACLMELTEAEPDASNDGGSGQWPALARFDARILLPARKTAKAEVKKIAIAFASWLNLKRIPGIYSDPCQVIACEPDEFSPQIERFRVWRVEWVMPVFFGSSAWNGDGTPIPTRVFVSCSPEIGDDHADDYSEVVGGDV